MDRDSGQVTIVGDGKATVKATKSGEDPKSDISIAYIHGYGFIHTGVFIVEGASQAPNRDNIPRQSGRYR